MNLARLLAILAAAGCASALSCRAPANTPACCRSRLVSLRMLAKRSKSGSKGAKASAAAVPAESVEPPTETTLPAGWDPIFPVESPQLWETHRVAVEAPSYEQVFQALRETPEDSLQDFVNVR